MIPRTEMIIVPNADCFSDPPYVFRFTDRESSISINSVVPTWKETSDPIEEVFFRCIQMIQLNLIIH